MSASRGAAVEREDGVAEIVDGKLFRVGANVPLDGRASWAPVDAVGFQPSNCYVLLEDDAALVVDPGFASIEREVVGGLRSVLPAEVAPSLFVTSAQYDCIGNVAAVASEFGVAEMYAGTKDPRFANTKAARGASMDSFEEIIPFAAEMRPGITLATVTRAKTIPVGDSRTMEVFASRLRVLATFWAYDSGSKTLFTSDAFTHAIVTNRSSRPVVDSPAADVATADDLRAYLLAKFEWLGYSDTRPIMDDVRSVFERYDVENIAPVRGCVLKGRAVAERHYSMFMDVLESFL